MNATINSCKNVTPGQPRRKLGEVRILLVDDHPLVREGLAATLSKELDLTVCGHAASATQALQAAATLHPDVAVVDLTLEGSHGLDLLKDLRILHPDVRLLVVSMHDEALYAERALRAGARGYLMKREPPEKLVEAVRKLARGELYFSQAILLRMHQDLSSGRRAAGTSPITQLADRELAVLELLGKGTKTRRIADSLHVSMKTIQSHCEHIKQKLELPDFSSLTCFAAHWIEKEQDTKPGGRDQTAGNPLREAHPQRRD
ncbi:MAG TPA: response regulator transcription factor [Verrucomicrobiae bacterium]